MRRMLTMLLALVIGATAVHAQTQKKLIIGTKEAPPFAMKAADGNWSGISIELWRRIAADLKLEYEFQESDLQGLLDGVRNGRFDASVAALTVTSDREEYLDFTQPFHTTGLAIATRAEGGAGWMAVARRLLSLNFLRVALALAALLLGVGFLVWLFERKHNAEQFGGGAARGIGAGFWWSAVTMTTVGYGDKAPRTVMGRLIGVVWMFAGLILIASFTAAIASALTVGELQSAISGPDDLHRVRVVTVANSTSAQYLDEQNIGHETCATTEDAIRRIADSQADAVVYDAPLLQYMVNKEFRGRLRVLPGTFSRQDYAIALPYGSPLRKPINVAMLTQIARPEWRAVLTQYLGR